MRTMYKGDIKLTYNEYKDIKDAMKNSYKTFINKTCVIKGDNGALFYINCTIADSVYGVDLRLKLTSKNNTIKCGDFFEEYSKISRLIGVKRIYTQDDKGNNIDFFINIDKVYNGAYFANKAEFYKSKLNILNWQMKIGEEYLLENEICYRNFDDKLDLALATYSILSNPCNLSKNIKELYLNKLYYVDIEIEDTPSIIINGRSYPKAKINIEDYDEIIDNIKSIGNKDKLLVYMLSLIYLIINNDLNASRSQDKDFITMIGYQLMDRYIELYTLK